MRRGLVGNLVLALVLLVLVLLVIVPFWLVGSGSIKLPREIISRVPTILPQSFTLQHFEKLLTGSRYGNYLVNSLIVATASAILTLLLAVPAAYAFFRIRFPGHLIAYRVILLAYAFPSIVLLVPLFSMFAQLGLVDNLLALILVNTALALPFAIWMLRSFFASIPRDIEEAAVMDGAPPLVILRRIMLPLVKPGIASVAIFAFIASWTEYVFASVLILSDAKRTMPVGFSGIIGQYQVDWGLLLAGATLAVVPVIIIFAIVGRWFVSGLTDGAVK